MSSSSKITKQPQKVVFITGASTGIGYSLAIEFAKRGYKVYAGARTVKLMEPLKAFGIHVVSLDVSSLESIKTVSSLISKENDGRLDILYNNAGVAVTGPLFDATEAEIENSFRVNTYGPIFLIQQFQKDLLNSKGTVVFTSSVLENMPGPFLGIYGASKAAFGYVAHVLSLETSKLGIKVVNIYTGSVETPMATQQPEQYSEDSIYYLKGERPIGAEMSENLKRQHPDKYAKNVVSDVEKAIAGSSPYTEKYRGGAASLSWFLSTFLSFNLLSKVLYWFMKLDAPMDRIAKKIAAESPL